MESHSPVRATAAACLRQLVPVSVRFGALCVAGLSPRHAVAFAIGETAVELLGRRHHAGRRGPGGGMIAGHRPRPKGSGRGHLTVSVVHSIL